MTSHPTSKGATSIAKQTIPTADKAKLIAEYADDMKALDIEEIDVSRKTSATERLVICTGTSDTHVNSIAERVAEKMREHGVKPLRQKTSMRGDGWVLLDYGDVVFHIFLEEKRQFYDLESLWQNTPSDPDLLPE
jgi:ribosome-associated protein